MFDFDYARCAGELKRRGYLYVQNGVSDSFLGRLDAFVEEIERGDGPDVYSIEPEGEDRETFIKAMESVTGEFGFTLSRHHVTIYEDAELPAHKDRASLAYSVGVAIRVSPESRVRIWPTAPMDTNTHAGYDHYTDKKEGQAALDIELSKFQPVSLFQERGDVVMFSGNRVYHQRLNPAGVIVYFIAVNSEGLDDRGPNRYEQKPGLRK